MILTPHQFLWATLALLAFILVTAVLGTLGRWVEHHTTRHQIIVESKRRRAEYLRALKEREISV